MYIYTVYVHPMLLALECQTFTMAHVNLVAIAGTTTLAPYNFDKSQQLIWRSENI